MKIIKTRDYQESLKHILLSIASDKTSAPYEVDLENQSIAIIGISKYKHSLK